jgi:hypothetical protein
MPDEFEVPSELAEDSERSSIDKDGNEIFYGECAACGEVTHHKVKDATNKKIKPGEVRYFVHPHCRDRFLKATSSKKDGNAGENTSND